MTLTVAAIIFGVAALGGATLVAIRLRGAPLPPTWMALGHGLVAAAGLVVLGYQAVDPGIPQLAQIALGIFVLAALGGAFVFINYHLKGRPLPVPLIVGHGLIAIAGFVVLLVAINRGP